MRLKQSILMGACSAFIVVCSCLFTVSWAQSGEVEDLFELSLEDLAQIIIYSASEFDESPLTVASTVSYISESQWQKMSVRRSREIMGHLPGVQVAYQVVATQAIHIRGFTTASTRGHATLLDGVPINSFAFNNAYYQISDVNLNALQNIEVIRGPVSVQYGSDAFHGAVAMRTYSTDGDDTQVSASLASNQFFNGSIRHGQQLKRHYMSVSFDVLKQQDQKVDYDWSDATSGDSGTGQWGYEEESYLGIVKWGHKDKTNLSYEVALYVKDENRENYPGYGQFFGTVLKDRNLYDAKSEFNMVRSEFSLPMDNDLSLNLMVFYWQSKVDDHRWFSFQQQRLWSKHENRNGAKLTLKQHQKNWHTRWSLAVETDYAKITRAQNVIQDELGNVSSDITENYDGFSRQIDSLSAQATTDLWQESVQLHYGLRFDYFAASGDQFSPRLGLVYLPTAFNAFKLLYGKGFRASSAGERAGFGNQIKGTPDLDPETIDTYELVYMYQGAAVNTELVLFHSDWKNSIISVDSGDPNFAKEYTNQGENESEGVEASLKYHKQVFSVDLSASFVRSENQASGQEYVVFPRRIFNIGLGYELPKYNAEIYLINRIEDDAHENTAASSKALSTFWQSDLHIGYWQSKQFQWKLDVRNLFDRDNKLPSTLAVENALPGEGFSILIGLTYHL